MSSSVAIALLLDITEENMLSDLSLLRQKPIVTVPPPTQTRIQRLPYQELTWENFERLCLRLVEYEANVEHCQRYGISGDEQEGIDIYARKHEENKYTVYQCKRVKEFGPSKIKSAVDKFLEGEWSSKTDIFVLCTQESLEAQQRADMVLLQAERLKELKITLLLWDEPKLSSLLKNKFEVVEDFFGNAWAFAFCSKPASLKQSSRISKTLRAFVAQTFEEDMFAELDQAGETDQKRQTQLRKVFVDLNVTERKIYSAEQRNPLELTISEISDELFGDNEQSAMETLLSEKEKKYVLIGGPGQGKSTLGQYIAQVHRASFLSELWEYEPKKIRLPFRLILKHFAQWLADNDFSLSLDDYLAFLVSQKSKFSITSETLQEIFAYQPTILILDGLDEVVLPSMRENMLIQIRSFIRKAELLEYDLFVLATSRPRGYTNDFDPTQYRHLEISALSQKKAQDFAEKWVNAKTLSALDAKHVISTFHECQGDRNLVNLLRTPLQVNIILLIIKGGGRPPSQREALFQEYWGTIFRREKGKAKGIAPIIQSDETLLLELHSYLGYLLHRKASNENVQSLLTETDFRDIVFNFLRSGDSFSADESIIQSVNQLITEARDRLVLIVEPQPGLFGFELRSFQEFFAAVHLARTASDTNERIHRLEKLTRAEHWHNVALFLAGRIVRVYGELWPILPNACKPADREGIYGYRKPGAWLALEIATDGMCGRKERNAQYDFIDYGCSLLESGLSEDSASDFESLLEQLSSNDKHDLLKPVLRRYVSNLSAPRSLFALELYCQFFGVDEFSKEKLNSLVSTSYVTQALEIAMHHEVDVQWMYKHLRQNWEWWLESLPRYWSLNIDYAEQILTALNLTNEEVEKIAYSTFTRMSYRSFSPHQLVAENFLQKDINTYIDQLLLLFRLRNFLFNLSRPLRDERTSYQTKTCTFFVWKASEDIKDFQSFIEPFEFTDDLRVLLESETSTVWLKYFLWLIYLTVERFPQSTTAHFVEFIVSNYQSASFKQIQGFFLPSTRSPVLEFMFASLRKNDIVSFKTASSILSYDTQVKIATEIEKTLGIFVQNADEYAIQRLIVAYYFGKDIGELLPELEIVANQVNISPNLLFEIFVTITNLEIGDNSTFSSTLFNTLLFDGLNQIDHFRTLWLFVNSPLLLPQNEAKLLEVCSLKKPELLDRVFRYMECLIQKERGMNLDLVILFYARLVEANQLFKGIAKEVFTLLAKNYDSENVLYFSTYFMISQINCSKFADLKDYLNSKNEHIKLGALLFWSRILQTTRPDRIAEEIKDIVKLKFDASVILDAVHAENKLIRWSAIVLLPFTVFPIHNKESYDALLNRLKQLHPNTDEASLWERFIERVWISDTNVIFWCKFFESILDHPLAFPLEILNATMERYQQITNTLAFTLTETDENEIGLENLY